MNGMKPVVLVLFRRQKCVFYLARKMCMLNNEYDGMWPQPAQTRLGVGSAMPQVEGSNLNGPRGALSSPDSSPDL